MGTMARRPSLLSAPLLPDHPPLLHRDRSGEHTVWVSPDLPPSMARATWSLSDFQLTKQLYKGKASTLYQAVDKPSGAVVALKSYSKRRLSTLNWYQVEREVRLHSQLRHPNVIALHAAFEDENYAFLVTEFAEGGDLYEDLKRAGGQLKERVVAGEVLPPFMAALTYMHAHSIIHRDIKPENILLAGDRTVKVADFGLSINWGEERPVTRAGTLDYMSPEVLACPEKSRPEENKERVELGYSDAVDVWAVGILAYELLVGRPPFERESREETYAFIKGREPALPGWMSEGACDFITAALAKNPRKRPSMAQLLQHPWIHTHARRPSIQPTPPGASDLHLPLHELAAFGELHRPSLHGAKSVRDLASLVSPSAGGTPHVLGGSLRPALSMAGGALLDAASSALSSSPGQRSTSTARSQLGTAPAQRPVTPAVAASPLAAAFAADLPAPAFRSSGDPVDSQGSSGASTVHAEAGQQAPGAGYTLREMMDSSSQKHSQFSVQSAASKLLSPSFSVQAAASPAAAQEGKQQSAFMELYKSLAPPPAEKPAPAPAPVAASPRVAHKTSSTASRGSGRSSTKGLESALPPLLHQQQQAQHQLQEAGPPPPMTAAARLPSLRKALSQPALAQMGEQQQPRSPAPVAAAAVDASAVEQAAKQAVAAVAAEHREEQEAPAAAPTASASAAVPSAEPEHAPLPAIPEQQSSVGSSEAELAAPPAAPSQSTEVQLPSKVQPAASALPAKPAPNKAAVAAAAAVRKPAERLIPAAHAAPPTIAAKPQPAPQASSAAGAADGSSEPASSAAAAHAKDVDRMREAEQRHVEKLRARAASAALPARGSASPAGSGARARAVTMLPSTSGSPKRPPEKPAGGSSGSSGSGLAKSAASLLNKLLRRKPAGAEPASPPKPAASMTAAGGARPAGAMVHRSAMSGSAAPGRSGVVAAGSASSGSPAQKAKPSPQAVRISVRAGPSASEQLLPSPRSASSQLHASSSGGSLTTQRRLLAASRATAAYGAASKAEQGPAKQPGVSSMAGQAASAGGRALPEAGHLDAEQSGLGLPAEAAEGPSTSSGGRASEGLAVEARSNSKSVRFAAAQLPGPTESGDSEHELQDLIRAFQPELDSEHASFTTAFSSLPASSLPSLTSGATSPLRASRKGSMSPPVSRKASHIAPSKSSRAGGSSSALPAAGSSRLRGGKTASMPGDSVASGKPASLRGIAHDEEEGEAGGEEGVQRSVASWSHPAGRLPKAGHGASKSFAAPVRLSMYSALLEGQRRAAGRLLPKPAPAGKAHPAAAH